MFDRSSKPRAKRRRADARNGSSRRASARYRRLAVERLERRLLLASEIQGIKWNDLDGDGLRGAGEPALSGVTEDEPLVRPY